VRRRVSKRADERRGVTIYGLDGTKRLLRLSAPDLKKEMDKAIRVDILGPLVRSAQSNVPGSPPMSNWNQRPHAPNSRRGYSPYNTGGRRSWQGDRMVWDSGEMRRKIRVRQGGRAQAGRLERAAWSIESVSPAAAAWELMGRGKSNTNMVRTARRVGGQTGRILYKAWDNNQTSQTAPHQIMAVVKEFEQKLQDRLRNVGDA